MIKVINVIGARPNYMKVAPLHKRMQQDVDFKPLLVHTGQHYGQMMSDIFLSQLGKLTPDYYLNVGSNTHARQTAEIMIKFEEVLDKEKPDLVVVYGDTNSTLAGRHIAAIQRRLSAEEWMAIRGGSALSSTIRPGPVRNQPISSSRRLSGPPAMFNPQFTWPLLGSSPRKWVSVPSFRPRPFTAT